MCYLVLVFGSLLTVVSIAVWEDAQLSGIAFGCGVLLLTLISIGNYTLTTVLAYIALLQLLICFVYINARKLLGTAKTTGTEYDPLFTLLFLCL